MRASRHFVLILALLAGSCGSGIDQARLDLCRQVLPALHRDGTRLREIRVAPEPPGSIRIDYAAQADDAISRIGFAVCEFAPGAGPELSGVRTAEGALGEARLLYLKRYWLAPGGGAADVVTPTPAVPELPASLAYALQQFVNALAVAAIYGLLAAAYSLIYGLVGRLNLAFGEIAVLGAYGAIGGTVAASVAGLSNPVAALALALIAGGALAATWSAVIGRLVVAPLHARHRHGQPILIATIALAVAIQEFLRLFQGARERLLAPYFHDPLRLARAETFVVTVTLMQLAIVGIAVSGSALMLWLFAWTKFGRQWRAFADDPSAAMLLGVAPGRIVAGTFLLAGLNAGIAGWIVAVYYGNVGFAMGTMLGLKALIAAVLGGIGRIEGALLGGIVIGMLEAGWSSYFDIASRDLMVFSLLAVVLILRPGGLLNVAPPDRAQRARGWS